MRLLNLAEVEVVVEHHGNHVFIVRCTDQSSGKQFLSVRAMDAVDNTAQDINEAIASAKSMLRDQTTRERDHAKACLAIRREAAKL